MVKLFLVTSPSFLLFVDGAPFVPLGTWNFSLRIFRFFDACVVVHCLHFLVLFWLFFFLRVPYGVRWIDRGTEILKTACWRPITHFEKKYGLGGSLETHVFKTILETRDSNQNIACTGWRVFRSRRTKLFYSEKIAPLRAQGKCERRGEEQEVPTSERDFWKEIKPFLWWSD